MQPPFPSPVTEWHNDTYAAIDPTRPELSVKGQKVIVTGGGYGIGRATAEAFAAAGAAGVAISGRKEAPLLETKEFIESKYGVPVSTHVADVTDPTAMKKAAADIGTWDILVMNAGYMTSPGGSLASDLDDWWRTFEVNIKGPFITCQAFMPTKGKKPIIVATATAAVTLPAAMVTNSSSYVASKLGLIKFIEVLTAEHPDVHITTIHPGIIETAMFVKSNMTSMPTDKVELPAHFTVWLTSPEAAFFKGKMAWCNWDVEQLKAKAAQIESSDIFTSGLMGWPFSA